VTDGDARSALAVVRSLGRAGHRVAVAAARAQSLAGSSRFAAERVVLPDPLLDPIAFGNKTIAFARERRLDFVLPIVDASVLALLPRRTELGSTVIPFPSFESFRDVSDKGLVADKAHSVGIRVPIQMIVERADSIGRLAAPTPDGVLVLKPARSVSEQGG